MITYCNHYKFHNCIIKVESEHDLRRAFNENIQKFEIDYHSEPDISIQHIFEKRSIKPFFKRYKDVFRNKSWIIQKSSDDFFYHYIPSNVKAISNIQRTDWKILVPPTMKEYYYRNMFRDLCLFYSDQIMMYPYIIRNGGAFVHGNGLYKNGNGILLIGNSGAGKTTLTKMLIDDGWTLLCDDRTIIINGMMYGHWCHGSYDKVTNDTHALHHVYNLIQNKNTYVTNMDQDCSTFAAHSVDHLDWNLPHNISVHNKLKGFGVSFEDLHFNLSSDVLNVLNKEKA